MENDLILLVEDDPDDEELALSALNEHGVGRIVSVHDGVQALDYLFASGAYSGKRPEIPRVVLLDLKLPKLNGLEVLRRLRSNPRTALIPVVIMTSSSEEQDRIGSYKNGANSYVRKPIDYDQFRAAVRQLGLYWVGLNEPATV